MISQLAGRIHGKRQLKREAVEMLERSDYARFHRAMVYPELLVIRMKAHRDGEPVAEPIYDYFEPVVEKKKERLHVRPGQIFRLGNRFQMVASQNV